VKMYEISVTDMEFEQCSADKERINIIIPYAVIHYVVSGFGYINGKRVGRGNAFFAPKNSHMDYYPDKTEPWSYVYVRLSGSDQERFFDSDEVVLAPFERTGSILRILSLYKELAGTEAIEKITANLIFKLNNNDNNSIPYSQQERNAQRIKKYIDNNYFKKITVTDISNELFLSSNYIRNLFMKYMNVSPKQYLQKKRMERAKELLTKTDMSVNLIASSVGYDDQLLFSKMFSQKFNKIVPKTFSFRQKVCFVDKYI
ncbi:MAG: AraC family transcriptional regulator, partial [Clostridia bacterium]|nr:AraC family transcriptional regulator [Clostridia bacterium]